MITINNNPQLTLLNKIYDTYKLGYFIYGPEFYLEDDTWSFFQTADEQEEVDLLHNLMVGNLDEFFKAGQFIPYSRLEKFWAETVSKILSALPEEDGSKRILTTRILSLYQEMMLLIGEVPFDCWAITEGEINEALRVNAINALASDNLSGFVNLMDKLSQDDLGWIYYEVACFYYYALKLYAEEEV